MQSGPTTVIQGDEFIMISPGIKEIIRRYALSNRAAAKSERTVGWYTDILKSFAKYLKEEGNSLAISSFNTDNVRKYVLHLRDKPRFSGHPFTPQQGSPLSPQTIRGHVRGLKAFSTWLCREGYTEQNQLKTLQLPKAPLKIMEPLTPEEINNIVASIDKNSATGSRNRVMFIALLDTGLRASELANATLGNLNLKDGHIKVMGKGAKERVAPIGKYVQMNLWNYIDKVRPHPASPDYDNLFLSQSGKPITLNTIKLLFSRLAKRSGIRRLHAHLCRYTFAVNYLLNGGDIFSLREILGHTTLEMVNRYLHFTSSQITAQHQKYSPMDRLQARENELAR